MLDPQPCGELARERRDRERQPIGVDEPLALRAEQLRDHEPAGAQHGLVDVDAHEAAALGDLDAHAARLAPAGHADRALGRLLLDGRGEGQLDGAARGDDLICRDVDAEGLLAHDELSSSAGPGARRGTPSIPARHVWHKHPNGPWRVERPGRQPAQASVRGANPARSRCPTSRRRRKRPSLRRISSHSSPSRLAISALLPSGESRRSPAAVSVRWRTARSGPLAPRTSRLRRPVVSRRSTTSRLPAGAKPPASTVPRAGNRCRRLPVAL